MASSACANAAVLEGPVEEFSAPPAKRAKHAPRGVEGAWGCVADDVADAVDWVALMKAFDELTANHLWSLHLTYHELTERLPLLAAGGSRRPLLGTLAGEAGEGAELPKAPAAQPTFVVSKHLTVKKVEGRGRGWFAQASLPAGAMVLAEKPLAATLDMEWRNQDWAGCDGGDSAALGIVLAGSFSQSLGAVLAWLHPTPGAGMQTPESGDGDEDLSDEDMAQALAALKQAVSGAWAAVQGLSDAERERLQRLVRLNSLGFYTHSEQLCHHGNFTALTGSGVYALASGFNHSCDPNAARFSIGDLTAFVTNRPLQAGDEICISYIETELLSAPRPLRHQSLSRDFTCACSRCASSEGDSAAALGSRRYLSVDEQLQANLALLPPQERVRAAELALQGELASGDESDSEECAPPGNGGAPKPTEEIGPLVVLGKDAQELRTVQALALMQMQRYQEALWVWRRLAAFTCHHCPPFDEALVVYATQASLCALACEAGTAADYAAIACRVHRIAFGTELFQWRYKVELDDAMVSQEVQQHFWKLVTLTSTLSEAPWADVFAVWEFRADEIPKPVDVV